MKKRSLLAPLFLAAALAAGACSPLLSDDAPADSVRVGFVTRVGDTVRGTGTVDWFDLEGGFFAIRGDDGQVYDPTNLPASFRKEATRVRFSAKLRRDLVGIHQVGEIVELREITGE